MDENVLSEVIRGLEEKIFQMKLLINRDVKFTTMSKEDQQATIESRRGYKQIVKKLLKGNKWLSGKAIKHHLTPYASDKYRYCFCSTVVPVGKLFNKDLVITNIDVAVEGAVYSIPVCIQVRPNKPINNTVVIPVLYTDGLVTEESVVIGGIYKMGKLTIQATKNEESAFSLLSYTVIGVENHASTDWVVDSKSRPRYGMNMEI